MYPGISSPRRNGVYRCIGQATQNRFDCSLDRSAGFLALPAAIVRPVELQREEKCPPHEAIKDSRISPALQPLSPSHH